MVIVDPQYRGKGIGTTLLERAIRYLESLSVPAIKLDATPQGKPLYEQFGFVSEYHIERWMLKRECGRQAPDKVAEEIEDALQLDREVFGADRRALLLRSPRRRRRSRMVRGVTTSTDRPDLVCAVLGPEFG